ncbi:MAG: SOS response-associated peptidase [Gemmatimonadota bacterium]
MCGRFTLATPAKEWAPLFDVPVPPDLEPRFNIAPTQEIAVVRPSRPEPGPEDAPPVREIRMMSWGLVPHWSPDPDAAPGFINARAETAAEKPAFRDPFRDRRCLVVADGFYEWRREGRRKQPYWIHPTAGGVLAFAGLWDRWRGPDRPPLDTCAILTTEANDRLVDLHDRMPVILRPRDVDRWLDPSIRDRPPLADLFLPFPTDALTITPVSTRVNHVTYDDPACLDPIENQEDLFR